VTEQIISEVGGKKSAKILFRGKIIAVERNHVKGHAHGEVVIKNMGAENNDDSGVVAGQPAVAVGGELRIPFMNENLLARHISENGEETVIASVPDLIAVLSATTGKALGIGEYAYGAIVNVLGIACSPVWNNERGLKAGGPSAFGFDDVVHVSLGQYQEPRSVIEMFS
jgi:DUF917 family protein